LALALDQQVLLDGQFLSPILRARLDIFLLLAAALQPSLKDLNQKADDDWDEIVTILAKILEQELPSMQVTADVARIWKQFRANARISKLGKKSKAILQDVETRLASGRRIKDRGLQYLDAANDLAVIWIQKLGVERKVQSFAGASKVPLSLYYDPDGVEFCASSSQLAGEIGWKLQLKEYAFYGALIPDMIFEHEYISHLLPKNQALSRRVRELWLSTALHRAHVNAQIDVHQRRVNLFLWQKFRDQLAETHPGGARAIYGPGNLENSVENTSFYAPEIFWLATAEIMDLANTEEEAEFMDALLETMSWLDDAKLRAALSDKWNGLNEFHMSLLLP
jgi:hypothetical protein